MATSSLIKVLIVGIGEGHVTLVLMLVFYPLRGC